MAVENMCNQYTMIGENFNIVKKSSTSNKKFLIPHYPVLLELKISRISLMLSIIRQPVYSFAAERE